MRTEKDHVDVEYGEWISYDADSALAEAKKAKRLSTFREIWPDWCEGVPTKFNRRVCGEAFFEGKNYHREVEYNVPVELAWEMPRFLSALSENKNLLPSTRTREWSGVYRIFWIDGGIERCCGKDKTGTLYIGMAGGGKRKWSILRDRIKAIATGRHHALDLWHVNDMVRRKFPRKSLAVEWAFTGDRTNHKGEQLPAAIIAEGFLLGSYNDSYGEYPPWNQRP